MEKITRKQTVWIDRQTAVLEVQAGAMDNWSYSRGTLQAVIDATYYADPIHIRPADLSTAEWTERKGR